jgi:signal transduction histidine kinase
MRPLSSLTNRMFVAMAALAVLSIGFATVVINRAVSRQAEAELARGLREAADLVEHYRALLLDHFTREAQLVADLPRLKAAVFENHPPTVQPIADEYRRQLDAALFVVTNARGAPLARMAPAELPADPLAAVPTISSALAGQVATAFVSTERAILQVVSVPIWIDRRQPELLGTLSLGFSFDDTMAARFKRLTESEIAFAFGGRLRAATLPGLDRAAVAALAGATGVSSLRVGNHDYAAIARSLVSPRDSAMEEDGRRPVGGEALVALVLRSRTERLRFLATVQTTLAATAAVAVLTAILLSYAVARTVTRPLQTIIATMREMAATGDLTRRIVLPSRLWEDEDARLLATTFNGMTEAMARFQQEAAQRERLSSLGRLSTVIAHEIRNPLMIIKASLRTLRREAASADELRAAVVDIDEEVARLNRLVSEVLDFARPIPFQYGPVDLNALCADAAAAVTAEAGDRRLVELALAPQVGELVTDGERLRLALVNVLVNARQAVEAKRATQGADRPAGPEPPIVLQTTVLDPDRVAIAVRDTGIGIPADDLPRVFEPFFTTKRTGSGLGLAIARNIVEGLGGTIAAATRPGDGTEIRIVLPRLAPRAGVGTSHAA